MRTRALHWIDRTTRLLGCELPVVHGPGFESARLRRGAPVLLVRNVRRVSRGRAESKLLSNASPGVYDLDDGLPWDYGNVPGLGHWWKRPFPRALIARRAASTADRVIAGNAVIADWASAWCQDVRIVPTCIEPHEYRRRISWELGNTPVIGWIGSPATEGYLADIAPALAELHRRCGARLEIVSGTGATCEALAGFTTRRMWEPAATTWIAGWDVGIMPLRDAVYERAKCGYKLLQYAASGVPFVASPVGVNDELIRRSDGIAASKVDEWVEGLGALLEESAGRRARRAERGFEVATAYSYARWEADWIDAVGWQCASST